MMRNGGKRGSRGGRLCAVALVGLVAACGGPDGGATTASSGASSGVTGAGSGGSGAGSGGSGGGPELPLYLGVVGSWCGPVDDETIWLTASLTPTACDASAASRVYSEEAPMTPPADGLLAELPVASLTSLPATFNVAADYCSGGVCNDVFAEISLTSYVEGAGAEGEWSAVVPSGETVQGRINTTWCAWDDLLPAHPQGERLARDISLSEIAVYQTVKSTIMMNGAAVDARLTDVVPGKDALFRVFVEPGPSFAAREVAVRLTLSNGGEPETFEESKVVSAASTDASLDSTFNFEVPAASIGAETTYQVEIRETGACSALEGAPMGARFPEAAPAELAARETYPVKVVIVPVRYETDGSGALPDTGEEQLNGLRAEFLALYPATELELTVREPIGTTADYQTYEFLDVVIEQIATLQAADNPPLDVHYYGLVSPVADFLEFCGGGCATGIGAWIESPFGPIASYGVGVGYIGYSAGTFVHELGHMHGRQHAPCGGAGNPDEEYPYEGGLMGSWGYDARSGKLLDPGEHSDFMGYCEDPWASDYTYQSTFDFIVGLATSTTQFSRVGPPQSFRTLLLDARGAPRWGLSRTVRSVPRGAPEQAEVLDAALRVLKAITVYRIDLSHGGAHVLVPEPEAGWAALRVAGAPPISFAERSAVPPYRR